MWGEDRTRRVCCWFVCWYRFRASRHLSSYRLLQASIDWSQVPFFFPKPFTLSSAYLVLDDGKENYQCLAKIFLTELKKDIYFLGISVNLMKLKLTILSVMSWIVIWIIITSHIIIHAGIQTLQVFLIRYIKNQMHPTPSNGMPTAIHPTLLSTWWFFIF